MELEKKIVKVLKKLKGGTTLQVWVEAGAPTPPREFEDALRRMEAEGVVERWSVSDGTVRYMVWTLAQKGAKS